MKSSLRGYEKVFLVMRCNFLLRNTFLATKFPGCSIDELSRTVWTKATE